jgi:endothelin-converting enzyme/putative endopeptidase
VPLIRRLLSPLAPALLAATLAGPPAAAEPSAGLPRVDPAVSPCEDFFRYACGPWIAANPIPPDQPRWGTFNALSEHNREILRDILEQAASRPDDDTRRIGTFYAACMDEAAAGRALGSESLAGLLAAVDRLDSVAALPDTLAALHARGINAFFSFSSTQDAADATRMIAVLDQAGLGLPDRDYYLKDDPRSAGLRQAYAAHVARIFTLAGDAPDAAARRAGAVLAVETALARGSMDRVERRDPRKTYNMRSRAELQQALPGFDMDRYLAGLRPPGFDRLNLASPGYPPAMAALLADVPLDDLRSYLRWHVLHRAAPHLGPAMVEEDFAFFQRTLRGQQALQPRWKRCVSATDHALGEDLGRRYVAIAFPGEAKAHVLELVRTIQEALGEDIAGLDWMGPETKAAALAKLAAMANKIGYPARWRDYSSVRVTRDDPVGNLLAASAFEVRRLLARIGQPVDRAEWYMTPPTVNAYYDPSQNDINFPAGILQPPFFAAGGDLAANYGAIGAVIGHEATHGFDDEGSRYDKDGNLKDWWQPEDAARFAAKTQCLADQYGGYTVLDGLPVNGRLTLGENTADNGGVRMALRALRKALARAPDQARAVGGFTPEQRLFLGYAQVWCAAASPEYQRLQVQTDPHAPPQFRTNGVVANMPEFAEAFHCPAGAPMARGERACRVW